MSKHRTEAWVVVSLDGHERVFGAECSAITEALRQENKCRVVHMVELSPWLATMIEAWRGVPQSYREDLIRRLSNLGAWAMTAYEREVERKAGALLRAAERGTTP